MSPSFMTIRFQFSICACRKRVWRHTKSICVGHQRVFCYYLIHRVEMRRVQFIELHEQPWFPSSLRDEVTDALQFGLSLFKSYAPIAPLLESAVDSNGSRSIADLCSGGGGPWLDLSRKLQQDQPALSIRLT